MNSVWDKIFKSDTPLTAEEQERALDELANAVADITKLQASSEHERIVNLIQKKLKTVISQTS